MEDVGRFNKVGMLALLNWATVLQTCGRGRINTLPDNKELKEPARQRLLF